MFEENKLSNQIIGAAIEVHSAIGPGLLESAYHVCLKRELELRGVEVKSEQPLPVVYKDVKINHGYRLDLLVENKVVVEIKSVESLHDVHIAQVLTYLKLSEKRLGLLLNFHVKTMKQGIKRVVL
jgi:GxxExxY protein